MSTSFQVRKTIFGKYNGVSSEDVKVYVEPNKVIFQECTGEENYISKIYLHNESLKLIECIIQQPKKSSLKVRMRKNIV